MIKLAAFGAFFRKPTSASLNLKRSSKTHQSSLNLKFFLKSPRPSLPLKKGLSKTHQSSLTLKGGSTSHLGLLPSGKKRKPLLLVALNHFILWLADPQRSTPAAELRFAGCDRLAELIACSYRKAACSLLAERLLIPCRKGGFSRPIPVNLVYSEQQECFSNCLSLRPATVGS